MKKILSTMYGRIAIGVALAVVIVLCACGSNSAVQETAAPETKAETLAEAVEDTAPETTAAATEAAEEPVEARTAIVFSILADGTITVERDGESEEAYEGMRLTVGDVVTTDETAQVYLRVDDDKNILLAEQSSMEITECKSGNLQLSLLTGEFFFDVVNPLADDDSMAFNAGGITMNVRGTSGGGRDNDEETCMYIFEGLTGISKEPGIRLDKNVSEIGSLECVRVIKDAEEDAQKQSVFDVTMPNYDLVNKYIGKQPDYIGRLVEKMDAEKLTDGLKTEFIGKINGIPFVVEEPVTEAPTQAATEAATQPATEAAVESQTETESSNEGLIEEETKTTSYRSSGGGGSSSKRTQAETTTAAPTEAPTETTTEAITCPECGEAISIKGEHLAKCGVHYTCAEGVDENMHIAAPCNIHYLCEEGFERGDHVEALCGISGHYECDGKSHNMADCDGESHFECDGKEHTQCPSCGMYICNTEYVASEHIECPYCGNYLCNGLYHVDKSLYETGARCET